MNLNDRITIPKEVVFQMLGEDIVLLQLESGVYHGLDPVGARVWQLLVTHGTPQAILDGLLEEYDVSAEVVREDVLHLLLELEAARLIEVTRTVPELPAS